MAQCLDIFNPGTPRVPGFVVCSFDSVHQNRKKLRGVFFSASSTHILFSSCGIFATLHTIYAEGTRLYLPLLDQFGHCLVYLGKLPCLSQHWSLESRALPPVGPMLYPVNVFLKAGKPLKSPTRLKL